MLSPLRLPKWDRQDACPTLLRLCRTQSIVESISGPRNGLETGGLKGRDIPAHTTHESIPHISFIERDHFGRTGNVTNREIVSKLPPADAYN